MTSLLPSKSSIPASIVWIPVSNVINTVSFSNMPESLKILAMQLPEGKQTISGITQEKAAKEFIRYGDEPWVIIEGRWWRLNPNRPNFRPKPDSKLFTNWGDAGEFPQRDLSGSRRNKPSMGALSPAK